MVQGVRLYYEGGYVESFKLKEKEVKWLIPNKGVAGQSVENLFRKALSAPLRSPPLSKERVERAAIIIPDHTRPPSPFLPLLLESLEKLTRDVVVVVAGGTHPPPTLSQLQKSTGNLLEQGWSRFRHSWAKAHPSKFKLIGYTLRGTPVEVNKELLDVDLIVSTLCVRPHYFAGWEGGAKAILPGCCSLASIRRNHSYAVGNPMARELLIDGNPVREDMNEAGKMLGDKIKYRSLDFVIDPEGRLIEAFYGEPCQTHRAAATRSREVYVVESEPASLVLTVAEGPLGRTLFQALKAYHHACNVAYMGKSKAKVILIASLKEGIGNEEFTKEYLRYVGVEPGEVLRDLKRRMEAGEFNEVFQKIARMAMDSRHTELSVVAPEAPAEVEAFLHKAEIEFARNLDEILEQRKEKTVIVPYGASTVPISPGSSTNTFSRST